MLEIKDVSFGYTEDLVISNFSLTVKQGERVAIQGKSGSGKSTILRLISGLEEVKSGHIYLNGNEITNTPTYQRHIGYVFQNFALFPHMTVRKNIQYGIPTKEMEHTQIFMNHLIEMFNIGPLLDKYPHQISGGEQQRVAVARTLVTKPKVLLLDESFSALDTELKESVRRDVLLALDELNITTILVTHDIEDAQALCHRIITI